MPRAQRARRGDPQTRLLRRASEGVVAPSAPLQEGGLRGDSASEGEPDTTSPMRADLTRKER